MLEFMVTDENSQYYGGFGNSETGEFYSFDNLMALKHWLWPRNRDYKISSKAIVISSIILLKF